MAKNKRERDKLARMGRAFERVDQLLMDLTHQGLQRLSRPVENQLLAVEQMVHHAGLVRLERELATLGTHARRYLDRDPLFDPIAWLGSIHRAWRLNTAAREAWSPDADLGAMTPIIGAARRAYLPLEHPLAVQAIAASGWVTESDFVGITVWLKAPNEPELYQASAARPCAWFGNDPRRLLFGDLSDHHDLTLLDLAHGAWVFDNARSSADGRLSLHRALVIHPGPWEGAAAYADLTVTDWQALVERLRDAAVGQERPSLVHLKPVSVSRLVIDDTHARATARMEDATGAWLEVEIPLDEQNNLWVDNLQRLTTDPSLTPDGWVGRAWVSDGTLKFLPYTALYREPVALDLRGRREVNTLHLSLEPAARVRRT